MKPILKLGFTDYFQPLDTFFIEALSRDFTIIRDDENPDYLIFCDRNFGEQNQKFNDRKVKKIFFTGENQRPWDYACHHYIGFDHIYDPNHYRLPLYVVDNWVYKSKGLPDVRDINRNALASTKEGFCSFVVRNPNCAERNNFFHKLSQYKQISSAGPLFNNMGPILENLDFHAGKLGYISRYKFNLCYENSSYPGYCTEKMFMALYSNTIPIYWGSPTAELDFNGDAFISRHNFDSDEDMIQYIIEVDSDDDLYNSIVQEPILAKRNRNFDVNRFVDWFKNVVYIGQINS